MENRSCNFFSNNNGGSSTRGQSSNSSTPAWDFWELGTTTTTTTSSQSQLIQWNINNMTNQDLTVGPSAFNSTCPLNSFEVERLVNEGEYYFNGEREIQYSTDHNLMSLNLNLGKRNYVENNYERPQGGGQVVGFLKNKRTGQYLPGGYSGLVGPSNSSSTVAAAAVPRCQVEGCHVALANSKAYHRRHKVCEMHAKAPKVVVLGLEQRFCQQCSRFHSVCEFDESKRSCRRRLAGHNERRRRKNSQDHSTNTRNTTQGNYGHLGVNDGRALSLLSPKNDSWKF